MKKLFRKRTNSVFFGICEGLGDYFGVDPVAFRLIWVLFTFITGIVPGILFYLIAIIIIPPEDSSINKIITTEVK